MISQRYESSGEHGEASWISMTDVFLLVGILFLGGAVRLARDLTGSRHSEHSLLDQLQLKSKEVQRSDSALASERCERDQLQDEVERLWEALERRRVAAPQSPNADGAEVQVPVSSDRSADLAERERRLRLELEESQRNAATTKQQLEQLTEDNQFLSRTLEERGRELQSVIAEHTVVQERMRLREESLKELEQSEGGVRQEMLGLEGELRRVVFLFDRSGSMKDRNRWEDAKRTMRIWLEHLPVQQASVVLFGSTVQVFPPDGSLADLNTIGRGKLVDVLADVTPTGGTDTYGALIRAYEYSDVDAFILFTDGQPNSPSEGGSRSGTTADVYALIDKYRAQGRTTRIHTVGVADYFKPSMGDYLLKVAKMTGGTFVGR